MPERERNEELLDALMEACWASEAVLHEDRDNEKKVDRLDDEQKLARATVLARMSPDWNYDLASAPRDGSPVQVAYRLTWSEDVYQCVCWRGDGHWQGGPAAVIGFKIIAWHELGPSPATTVPELTQ